MFWYKLNLYSGIYHFSSLREFCSFSPQINHLPYEDMNSSIGHKGYIIHRNIITASQVTQLRHEADIVASDIGTACVRHLRSRSKIFNALSVSKTLLSLLPAGLRPVRSILFDKTASENWPVLWHQDLTIAVIEEKAATGYSIWSHKDGSPHVQPPVELLENMVTIRLHLDDATAANGALRVIPGSHCNGKISPNDIKSYHKEDVTTCECLTGDVLLMSPLLLHSSQRSENPTRRRVIHLEYARDEDLDKNLEWFESTINR